MKTRVLTAGLMLLFSVSFGQTKRPVLVGIDVLKPILSAVTPNRPAYRLAEVTLRIPMTTNYLSIVGGYGQLKSDTVFRNTLLYNRGYYLKVGIESPAKRGLVLGWHGLMAMCHESGSYSFKGYTFGDYTAPIAERQRIAIGFEGFIAYQTSLSERLLFQVSGRATIAGLVGPKDDERPAYFVPGVGNEAGDPLVYSLGLGLHLFYQIPARPRPASSNE